ncbi:probable glutamate receptor isoform X2 [Diachasmimorpha longicaudata]
MAIAAIIKKLSQSMNFTLGKILWEKAYGLRYKGMSNWTGIIGRIQRKEADLILSPLIMSSERYDYLQFTSPILYGVYQLHVRKLDTAQLSWNAYFKVFAADVWIVIIGLILTVPIILTFMERHTKKSSFLVLLSKHYTFVWGVFCQQGLSDFPDELPLRITYISLITSSLIVSATYGASFMSTLAVSSSFAPFSSVEEFLRDGRYKLIVTRNSTFYYEFKNSNLTFMKQMMSLMKPVNLLPINYENGFEQICTERVAFYTHEVAKKGLVNNFSCEIASIKAGNMETLALGMPRNNPYYEPINHFVQNMALKGIFQELLTEHSTTPSLENGFESVYLQRITPLIVVWLIGLGIALIIFIFEKNLDVSIKEARDKNRGVKNNRK